MTATAELTEERVMETLRGVRFPGLSRDIVSFGFVKDVGVVRGPGQRRQQGDGLGFCAHERGGESIPGFFTDAFHQLAVQLFIMQESVIVRNPLFNQVFAHFCQAVEAFLPGETFW